MKRILSVLCAVLCIIMLLPGCGETEEKPTPETATEFYYREIPTALGLKGETVYVQTETYEEAKEYADKYARYGVIVVNENYECIYAPYGEAGSEICYQGKIVCDYIRDNDFTYGNAPINPAYDHTAHIVSCDRLVDWILYRSGFVDQVYNNGTCVSGPWLTNWCIEQGFEKIENIEDLQGGDVIFVRPNSNGDPLHTFICAGASAKDGLFFRYDAGSNARINSTQPSCEVISDFMYGYRATKLPAKGSVEIKDSNDDNYVEIPTFPKDKTFETVLSEEFDDNETLWSAGENTVKADVNNDCCVFTVEDKGGEIVCTDALGYSCEDVNCMRIKLLNGVDSRLLKVNFVTDEGGSGSVLFTLGRMSQSLSGKEWQEALIDFSGKKAWKGKITELSFTFVSGSGDVKIDFITLDKMSDAAE